MSIHQIFFSGYTGYLAGLTYSYWTTNGTNPTNQTGFDALFTGVPAGTGVHSTDINWDHTNSRGTKPSYLPNDAYAWQVEGYIYVPTSTTYEFGTGSDDGNQLTIAGTIVTSFYGGRGISGSVTSPAETGSISLSAGYHTFRYRMQEGAGGDGGYVALKVSGSFNVLPASYFFRLQSPPSIVTSGLVLHLDAGNTASYPGSGTTWSDLSGNGNNVTLSNGPTYSSADGGSIVFDGVDDYADFFAPSLGTTTTVEMWAKIGAGYSGKMFFGWLLYDVFCGNGHLGYNTASGDVYGISSATVSSLGLVNNWKHYVFEMRTDVSYTNNKIYINGSLQTLSQQQGSENASNRSFNSGNGRIAGWRTNNNYRMPMNCASFIVYNRALTASEIQQNYNALEGRFGL